MEGISIKIDCKQYILFICLIIICGFLLFQLHVNIQNNTIEQINNVQLVHAKQAENNLNSFFENFNSSLFFLAGSDHIISLDSQGSDMMRSFFLTHQIDISSITRVNEKGIILYSYPVETSTGKNISGQSHVRKVIQTHKKVISDVFTSVQGFRTVAFHVPIFSENKFKGSIALLIPFDTLAKKTLDQIHVLHTGYAFALSDSGVILYSPFSDQIGKSVYEVYTGNPSVLTFIEKAKSEGEGTGTYLYNPPTISGNTPQKYHAVHESIEIEDLQWSVIIATPEKEILNGVQIFTRDFAIISTIIIISLLFFAYYYVKARGIVREEEKRKKVESALRKSEENYRMIFNSIQEVFYRSDEKGNLAMMNPSGINLFGYESINEIFGKNFADTFYLNPKEKEHLDEDIKRDGFVKNYAVTLKTKNGDIIYGQTSSHLIYNDNKELVGVEGIIHDITNEKLTNKALQQALRKLNLLNSVTFNDIHNSFFSFSGYFSLLKSMTTDNDSIKIMEKEEKLISSIMNSLDFAKDYQGLGMTPPSWQNVEQAFLFGISHTDLSPYTRVLQIKSIEIFADPLLEKVFFIFAENLIHHSKKATEYKLYYQKTEEGLIMYFEDNGVGIPPSDKELIFERRPGPHNGMGLYFAREILGITDITLRETGIPGDGAIFEIVIPLGVFRFTDLES